MEKKKKKKRFQREINGLLCRSQLSYRGDSVFISYHFEQAESSCHHGNNNRRCTVLRYSYSWWNTSIFMTKRDRDGEIEVNVSV